MADLLPDESSWQETDARMMCPFCGGVLLEDATVLVGTRSRYGLVIVPVHLRCSELRGLDRAVTKEVARSKKISATMLTRHRRTT